MHAPQSPVGGPSAPCDDDLNGILPRPPLRLLSGSKTSIFLLGSQGTGKSTLGIIASVHLGRRLIDWETYFHQQTGTPWTPPSGTPAARAKTSSEHYRVLESLVANYSEIHVVVCPLECLRIDGAQLLFRRLARTSPVILVLSDLATDNSFAGTMPGLDLELCLTCSSHAYFNLSEECHSPARSPERPTEKSLGGPSTPTLPTRFLHLKRLEQEFIRFLGKVLRTALFNVQTDTIIDVPLLLRNEYTYVLPVGLADLAQDSNLCEIVDDAVDAIELRIDIPRDQTGKSMPDLIASIARGVTRLRRVFCGPIIYHVEFPVSPSKLVLLYRQSIYFGLRLGVDYLTIDLRCHDYTIQRLVNCRANTSIIGHLHDPAPGESGWQSPERLRQFNHAKSSGFQVIRLTQVAQSKSDNLAVQHFIHSTGASPTRSPSLIAYNTGPLGKTSCCFNNAFTPVRSCRPTMRHSAPPRDDGSGDLISIPEAQRALFSSFFNDPLKMYIVGTDVSRSLAPLVYDVALKHVGIPHSFDIRNATAASDLKPLLYDGNFGGASLAQGFKLSILPLIEHLSVSSSVIGAVNTIMPIRCEWKRGAEDRRPPIAFWRDRNHTGPVKGLYGENTDWIGMYRCVKKRLSPVNAVNSKTTGLVLGAGGMARAAVYAMIQMGVRNIFVYNRTTSRATELADYFNGLGDEPASVDPTRSTPERLTRSLRQWTAKVHVIEEIGQQWPAGFAQPTIVISCLRASPGTGQPTPNITMPPNWLRSPHGGVVVDVSCPPQLLRDSADR